jgi:hypothetical protein
MNQAEAITYITRHPDIKVQEAAEVINEAVKRRHRIINLVQEAIAQLRLDMKYLIFDLEATRRERDEAQG